MISTNLHQPYGEFLNKFHWDWYCTLTFRNQVSSRMAFKRFNNWKIQLKKATNQRIDYAMVIEHTYTRIDIPHLHLFLAGAGREKPYIWEKRWYAMGGLAKIEPYDPKQGASYYLGSKIASGMVDVIFSRSLLEIFSHSS